MLTPRLGCITGTKIGKERAGPIRADYHGWMIQKTKKIKHILFVFVED